jgi:chromate transporter
VLALFTVYNDFSSDPLLRSIVTGVGAAGAGLFIGTALKLGRAIVRKPAALVLIAACFLAVAIARFSLVAVMPAGVLLAWLAARRNWL